MTDVQKPPRIAVLLSGCGHLDGAEVREAVLTGSAKRNGSVYRSQRTAIPRR